jgi:BlaI family penicillinase repressor
MRHRKALSELEHMVMDLVWSLGSANTEQAREALLPQRKLKESTVRTVLRRLEEKGYVKHTVDGRTYVYTGVEPPRNVAVSAVRQLIERFCGGSAEELLAGMVDAEIVDEETLRSISQRLARRKRRKKEV